MVLQTRLDDEPIPPRATPLADELAATLKEPEDVTDLAAWDEVFTGVAHLRMMADGTGGEHDSNSSRCVASVGECVEKGEEKIDAFLER
ncbi:MAG: hypothetical protein C0467_33305 [Planctomycetaceae bacterium]|nr:hypothetical protein [Planctomycetaceae bacterium]